MHLATVVALGRGARPPLKSVAIRRDDELRAPQELVQLLAEMTGEEETAHTVQRV